MTIAESSMLVHELDKKVTVPKGVEVVLVPSALALQTVGLQLKHHRKFKLAAQNCYWRDSGPYTGEISAHMLRGLTQYVIVGHSERRHVFGEHDNDVRHKVQAVVRNQMQPILCVGETAQEKADGDTNFVLHDQVTSGLANVTSEELSRIVIAYEPVWAISNGVDFETRETPTPDQATRAAEYIRKQVEQLFGKKAADDVRILYGASVNQDNARGFITAKGVDGLLVGGASLKPDMFAAIVANAQSKRAEIVVK